MLKITLSNIFRFILMFSLLLFVALLSTQIVFAQADANSLNPLDSTINEQDLNRVNPLRLGQVEDINDPISAEDLARINRLSKPASLLGEILVFAFPLSGVILLVMILWGGFEMVSGAANKKSMDAGRQRITAAVVGFVLLFVSYWIIRIVEQVFGIQIVNFT